MISLSVLREPLFFVWRWSIHLTISQRRRVCRPSLICMLSVDDDILGGIVPMRSRPLSNLLIQTYDYWIFLLQSRWTKVKGLYIVTRHLPFLLLITDIYLSFTPNENLGECRTLDNICSGLGALSVICSECFFILRTYALWNNNRILLAVMLSTFLAFIVAAISTAFANTVSASYATSRIPGITGCYQSSDSVQLFIPFLLLTVLELGLMILTLIHAIQNWQVTNGHLYIVLLKHNILYYACGLFFSVVNIFTSLLLHYAYHAMLHDFQFIILAILATRMHRHLWHEISPDALMRIPMSDMLTADRIV
ncbi:uncharacterized protein EDB91DRAFT_1336798 [Suillus paluster]|uniref:uncharacterized protein n=1 Tax=Suillus paluster TaxID=48578 RepID=UPI001B86EE51|nr:uncharacterized protein EDB91DRAFT_1336798 [Suillus paluster]KAG1739473.1 hypothetical protein EDB91DRAFT_1336798 [Suillus paluster]